jgi:hypothetical protein
MPTPRVDIQAQGGERFDLGICCNAWLTAISAKDVRPLAHSRLDLMEIDFYFSVSA